LLTPSLLLLLLLLLLTRQACIPVLPLLNQLPAQQVPLLTLQPPPPLHPPLMQLLLLPVPQAVLQAADTIQGGLAPKAAWVPAPVLPHSQHFSLGLCLAYVAVLTMLAKLLMLLCLPPAAAAALALKLDLCW